MEVDALLSASKRRTACDDAIRLVSLSIGASTWRYFFTRRNVCVQSKHESIQTSVWSDASAAAEEHPSFESCLANRKDAGYSNVLSRLTHLQSLHMGRLELMAAMDLSAQLQMLSGLTNLTGLSLTGDIAPFQVEGCEWNAMSSALKNLQQLRHLSIEGRNRELGGHHEDDEPLEWCGGTFLRVFFYSLILRLT